MNTMDAQRVPLLALCGILASRSWEAARTWSAIEAPMRREFGVRLEPLARAMQANDHRTALAAAEALAGAADDAEDDAQDDAHTTTAPARPAAVGPDAADKLRHAHDVIAELEAFSYSISHDLREPLRAITCFAQTLQDTEAGRMSVQGRHRLERVVQGALRMNRMIEDILACSRAERCDLRRQEVDLGVLAREVVDELRPGHGRVRVEIAPLPRVPGDTALLRQVFANLVGNALKFSRGSAAPLVRVDAVDAGAAVEVRVHDNGAGFDAAYASRLFQLFQRLHTEKEFPGTGVGLAIVKRVVARHGGSVRAESQPGVRTTFAFTLPKAPQV
jgi:signal transduction histidine kinase